MSTVSRSHGTTAKYHLDRCRCYPCCHANSQYESNRRRAMAYGTWQPFVDAGPVRTHVRQLGEFGIGWIRAAKLAGVATGTVSKLLYGDRPRNLAPTKRMRPEVALALLSVEPTLENMGPVVPIDGTGTRRRLQALVAAGWPQSEIARRLGMERANFGRTIVSPMVRVSTLRAVVAVYDELWRANPREHGVPARWYTTALATAARNGWAPVGAWDDDTIDDPAAFPDWTGHCGTTDGPRHHYRIGIPVCQPCREARQRHRAEANAQAA
ncbi:hypothetical protein [Streptomyces lavendofoliae]|uniref:Uncharacterized protein n=1 Tax=Streptomyces lavendofoliae TaxID=67314 RepID=A0A918I4D8_9ACTN|nr:hypothetical protein [Streptomyces lavendofoliae]GGU61944.1 hypothetical protein GCM10010274_58390 [Streptomyces lavendofoliae]